MTERSLITGKTYDNTKVVYYRDTRQSIAYMQQGCIPLDLFVSNGVLVFVFSKEDHKKYKQKWMNHEI